MPAATHHEEGMPYEYTAIACEDIPAAPPEWQHTVDIYAGETNKTISVWRAFADADLDYRPHAKSSGVRQIMEHQLLSERRFFAEFLGSAEPPAGRTLPAGRTVAAYQAQVEALARPRLAYLAGRDTAWWLEGVRFFDVSRPRIWVFWRRVLHTAHHRTQLSVYLRLLDKTVVPTYGPTADVTWAGADPTLTVEAAERGGSGAAR